MHLEQIVDHADFDDEYQVFACVITSKEQWYRIYKQLCASLNMKLNTPYDKHTYSPELVFSKELPKVPLYFYFFPITEFCGCGTKDAFDTIEEYDDEDDEYYDVDTDITFFMCDQYSYFYHGLRSVLS